MVIKVLVVDDSFFFRQRVSEIIDSDPRLKVIGVASDGREAVQKARQMKPDVITMDVEMPVMDGITAVQMIMKENPTPILMFSSLTYDSAKATLDALEAGALDFLSKKFVDVAQNYDQATQLLKQKIVAVARNKVFIRTDRSSMVATSLTLPHSRQFDHRCSTTANQTSIAEKRAITGLRTSGKKYQVTTIGASTGGPAALQYILTKLPENYPHPIVLILHMPAAFTAAFANRLNYLCKIRVKEGKNGERLCPGVAYVAPGGVQTIVRGNSDLAVLRVFDSSYPIIYKPCIDITFSSIAKTYQGEVLSIILTGMGSDGCEGARVLKAKGATVWAQDKKSCVVYGMPRAVVKAGLATESLLLEDISDRVLAEVGLR